MRIFMIVTSPLRYVIMFTSDSTQFSIYRGRGKKQNYFQGRLGRGIDGNLQNKAPGKHGRLIPKSFLKLSCDSYSHEKKLFFFSYKATEYSGIFKDERIVK